MINDIDITIEVFFLSITVTPSSPDPHNLQKPYIGWKVRCYTIGQ